jgi:hypothetical protein
MGEIANTYDRLATLTKKIPNSSMASVPSAREIDTLPKH